eukprot:Tamp_11913.p1 GENE.Tamp_11913~~Tamp_11913.p1  ORF type:complete len:334 (+),score=48.12 Tamp_11913:122-1003(+)
MPKRTLEAVPAQGKEHAKRTKPAEEADLVKGSGSERGQSAAAAKKAAGSTGKGKAPALELAGSKKEKSHKTPKEMCAICQELLNKTKTETKELGCGHTFHRACLVPWFRDHTTCPCCRTSAASVCTRGELLINTPGPAPGVPGDYGPFGPGFGFLTHSMLDSIMRSSFPGGGGLPGPGSGPMMMQLGGGGPGAVFMLDIAGGGPLMIPALPVDEEPPCDCEACRERNAALDQRMTCSLCQAFDDGLDPSIEVWPCDKCDKSFCTSCRAVGSCMSRSCEAQLCTDCAPKVPAPP